MESFRFVLKVLRGKEKFVTVHSRRAESAVLDMLEEEGRSPVVFHWFSGSTTVLRRALARGHFFSINPAMAGSPNGKKVIAALPPERVLTETDGPFVQVGGRPAVPLDVGLVEDYLAGRLEGPKAGGDRPSTREFHGPSRFAAATAPVGVLAQARLRHRSLRPPLAPADESGGRAFDAAPEARLIGFAPVSLRTR